MLETLKKLFRDGAAEDKRGAGDIRLAAAALLVEVARADHDQDTAEDAAMATLLTTTLDLDPGDVDALLGSAGEAVAEATSLFDFTRLINEHYTPEEKFTLVQSMWQVAYADASLDKYEEHIIRRVADLVYLPHAEFIRARVSARAAAEQFTG